MGIQQEIGSSEMKVAIGNAFETLEYRNGTDTIRLSVLFFAYALANDASGYRLKIDAADGFFGLGFSYNSDSHLSFRFRALHLSAHLVDGHYDTETDQWRDGKEPFPFSRNYGEIVAAYTNSFRDLPFRLYAGFSYAAIIKPTAIRPWAGLAGYELHSGGGTHAYFAHHFSLMGTPVYIGGNTIEAGVKFGNWQNRGARLFVVYQNGWNNFGEYYNERREFFGVGFAFDFWD
jgi:hypothetical protein